MVCGAETPFKALLLPLVVIMENSKGDLKKAIIGPKGE